LTGGFDFSGSGDFTSCPPVEQTEMSNSEPSTIVPHGIRCIAGLYKSSDGDGENLHSGSPRKLVNYCRRKRVPRRWGPVIL